MKFKESLRRLDSYSPNQIVLMMKKLGLEDDKRRWNMKFSMTQPQQSWPLTIREIQRQEAKAKDKDKFTDDDD